MTTTRIPADIDQEDKLLAGLTARQLVLVSVPAVCFWAAFMLLRSFVPLVAFIPVAVVGAGVIGTLAVARRDGIAIDRFAVAAIRHRRASKSLVTLPGTVNLPGVSNLQLPILGVTSDGVLDLGAEGSAILCEASATNLLLQDEQDQAALTAAFGKFCNSLDQRAQFLVRTEPVDMVSAVRELQTQAAGLATIGLERAAVDHATFLQSLASRHDVVRRVVLIVLCDPSPANEAELLLLQLICAQQSGIHGPNVHVL